MPNGLLTYISYRLRQYYVQPICTPSRSALMAGRYPYNLQLAHGVIGVGCPYGLNLSEVTLADQMRKAGYATHAIGNFLASFKKYCHIVQCLRSSIHALASGRTFLASD